MDVTRIPADPDAGTARAKVFAALRGLGSRTFELPGDAELTAGPGGVRVRAAAASDDNGVLLYLHGGGFESRMPELLNLEGYRLSAATRRPVHVVHYRLAPAHPYPAALDDAVSAYRSLLAEGVPAERIAVFSESSGAVLALSALQVLRDNGEPLPATVVTVSAVTDLTLSSTSIDTNTAEDAGVDRALLTRLIGQYLGGTRPDAAPQSPLHGDLAGLPPLLMLVGSAEALLDDTMRFARKASAAGTPVRVDVYEAMPHAFHITVLDPDENPVGRTVLDRVARWIGGLSR